MFRERSFSYRTAGRALALAGSTALATGVVSLYRHPFATRRALSRRRLLLAGVAERAVDLGGLRMRYLEARPCTPGTHADDEPLVLLHGFADSAETWARVFGALARHRRVLAPDLPGFGRTPAPVEGLRFSVGPDYLARFLDALGLDRVVLVGNSLGGAVAIRYTAQHPGRVSRLFLLNSAGLLDGVPDVLDVSSRRHAAALASSTHGVAHVPAFILDDLVRMAQQPLWRAALRSAEPVDVKDDLSHIAVPVTIIWGEEDRLIPVEHGLRLREGLARAELIVLPGVGHLPQILAPRQVLQIIQTRLQLAEKDRRAASLLPALPSSSAMPRRRYTSFSRALARSGGMRGGLHDGRPRSIPSEAPVERTSAAGD